MTAIEPLLTPGEVAKAFRVDPATVKRWVKAGKLSRLATPGGHGRYREAEVRALLEGRPYAVPADGAAVYARLGLDDAPDLAEEL